MKHALFGVLVLLCSCSSTQNAASAPPGSYLVVLNKNQSTLSVIEPNSGHTRDDVVTGFGPHEVAAARDGVQVVVANYGDQTPGHTLTVYDLVKRRVITTIDIAPHQRPHGVAFLDRRSTVLVTSETSHSVLEVDVRSGRIVRTMDTGAEESHMLVIAPDRSRVFTANIRSGSVSAIDLKSGKLIQVIPTGDEPEAIDMTPDGREVWVAHRRSNDIAVIDAQTLEKKATIACARLPIRLKFTPDGGEALVTCAESGDVAVIDAKRLREIARIDVAHLPAQPGQPPSTSGATNPTPIGIVIDPSGRYAYVALSAADKIAVIDVWNRTVTGTFDAGSGPDGMAWCYRPFERFTFLEDERRR